MTGGAQDSGVELDLSWIDIAVTHRREVCILGYSDGWKNFDMEHWWEDTFSTPTPEHLEPGAYRWTGYIVGPWDEDEFCVVTKGEFFPIPASPAPAGWQPIESAPRDGTKVLIYIPAFDEIFASVFDKGVWQTGVWSNPPAFPTLWQPLPTAPAEGGV